MFSRNVIYVVFVLIRISKGNPNNDDEDSESKQKGGGNRNDDEEPFKDHILVNIDNNSNSHELHYRRQGNDKFASGEDMTLEQEDDTSSIRLTLYPYAVSIQNKGMHYATASIVSNRWLLTAALDFYNVRESIRMLRARLGSIDCKRGGYVKRIREIVIHPLYQYNVPNYDLALLKLSSAVKFGDDIKPIALTSSMDSQDLAGSFISTYWARLFSRGRPLPDSAAERVKDCRLRVFKKTTVPFEECSDMMRGRNITLEKSSFCYNPFINFHSPCMPDNGAPVVVGGELWAITSPWTADDCSEGNTHPTFATRLSDAAIKKWISETFISFK